MKREAEHLSNALELITVGKLHMLELEERIMHITQDGIQGLCWKPLLLLLKLATWRYIE